MVPGERPKSSHCTDTRYVHRLDGIEANTLRARLQWDWVSALVRGQVDRNEYCGNLRPSMYTPSSLPSSKVIMIDGIISCLIAGHERKSV